MITKKHYCNHIIDKFCTEKGIKREELKEEHALESSVLAVCMEHMNMLKSPKIMDYASGRGGNVICSFDWDLDKSVILTARNILNLLPDNLYAPSVRFDKTFVELYKNKEVTISDVENYTEAWHNDESLTMDLHEFLGMNDAQYDVFLRDNVIDLDL